jgi:hypothetical protein
LLPFVCNKEVLNHSDPVFNLFTTFKSTVANATVNVLPFAMLNVILLSIALMQAIKVEVAVGYIDLSSSISNDS